MNHLLDRLDQLDLADLTDRYVAVWNEPAPDRRRQRIAELWAPGGGQILVDPPEKVRAAADLRQLPHPPWGSTATRPSTPG